MMKYIRVMDGLKSNAGGFNYKLDEINISEHWDTSTLEHEKIDMIIGMVTGVIGLLICVLNYLIYSYLKSNKQ